MKQSLISIIVPVYNVEKYLDNCIQSIFAQTYGDWELILVDDGSPDNSPHICDKYAAQDSRIRVIHKQNGGLSSARNAGLDIILGEYVTFLDSDDFWHSNYLQILLVLCEENDADIVQCGFTRGQSTLFPTIKGHNVIQTYDNHSIFLKRGVTIIMCGKLYKKHLFTDIRMPLDKINEDDFTSWKLYYKASRIVATTQVLYYYTCNPQSIMAQQNKRPRLDFMEAYDERIYIYESQGVRDLQKQSQGYFCLVLLLVFGNSNLSSGQRNVIAAAFYEHWRSIKWSPYVPILHRMLFYVFAIAPYTISRLIHIFRN